MINIFLKKDSFIELNGETYTDRDCIWTRMSEREARALLGDAVESVYEEKRFFPQAHAYRFDQYKRLNKEAA